MESFLPVHPPLVIQQQRHGPLPEWAPASDPLFYRCTSALWGTCPHAHIFFQIYLWAKEVEPKRHESPECLPPAKFYEPATHKKFPVALREQSFGSHALHEGVCAAPRKSFP